MITIHVVDFKGEMDQKSYSDIINNIDLNTIECPFCHRYDFQIHGYYTRYIKTIKGKIELRIERVKCACCHHTHALMPSLIVPYQSILLKDQIIIIQNENIKTVMDTVDSISDIDVYRINNNYNQHFKERLISFGLCIDENIVINCFRYFKRQFLQIKRLTNILVT